MAPLLAPQDIALDCLCCMGIGFLAAALRVQIPTQNVATHFVADFCMVLLALVLVQAYAAQSSNASAFRFYMLLSLAVGALVFIKVIAPYQLFLMGLVHAVAAFPLRIMMHELVHPAVVRVKQLAIAQKERAVQKKIVKNHQKQLQSTAVLLYNSNMDVSLLSKTTKS